MDYVTPGYELTLAVKKIVQKSCLSEGIIFLKNHGIIITSQTAQNALNFHKEVHIKIQNYFSLSSNAFEFEDTEGVFDLLKNHVLFPDQVVYALNNTETTSAKEILTAYSFILQTLKEKRLTPTFLSKENIEALLDMESEKYRQKISMDDIKIN